LNQPEEKLLRAVKSKHLVAAGLPELVNAAVAVAVDIIGDADPWHVERDGFAKEYRVMAFEARIYLKTFLNDVDRLRKRIALLEAAKDKVARVARETINAGATASEAVKVAMKKGFTRKQAEYAARHAALECAEATTK